MVELAQPERDLVSRRETMTVSRTELVVAGATTCGQALLAKLGFRLIIAGDGREDGSPVYVHQMSQDLLDRVSGAVRDGFENCQVSWSSEPAARGQERSRRRQRPRLA